MVKPIWRKIVLVCCVQLLMACQQEPAKTDAMLFREATITKAQVPLDKALKILTPEVQNQPMANLDSFIVANQGLRDARQVYANNNITHYQDNKLNELEGIIHAVEPELVSQAKELLNQTVDKTVELRTEIEEAKNQPYSARGNDTAQLVEFLGKQYNQDVKECCLKQLSQIDQLLKDKTKEHRALIILIRSINQELAQVIKQKDYAQKLKNQIQAF
ncbi:hypothetical protein Q4574_06105 [Aliiglaciecola sp. 3_MG-2023]|uniref:hypothetical protein n=1 Tax=Aliiglaciecola sp. 3_MG-2023 TaxID=3062644 RepID=UPI0026E3FE2A|nr:hypothetical protein [Aliiglaciecola sp. 3_MG-2023]MDO6692848.1 hypothetical protein [Aliiglaciecola sp. 3_MG-2023]